MHWKPDRSSHLTIHTQIIEWIKSRIDRGDWLIGTKLPTQRHLAELLGVNRSTINNVMEELKAAGLIESKIGSGTYVSNNSWNVLLSKSQPNWQQHIEMSIHKANYHTIQLINDYEQKEDIIRLGTGELSPDLLPSKKIEESLKEIQLDGRAIGYSEPQGSKKLRRILSDYLNKRGIQANIDNILIVSGALQTLQLVSLGLLEENSIIFQEAPSYLNSIHTFQSAGMNMIAVHRNAELKSTLRNIKKKKQSLFYCSPTLQNPSGGNWSMEERQNFYDTCKELKIPIIEDDVYHELLFEQSLRPTLKSIDDSGLVLYLGSVSKTLSPGLRIGWVVGPEAVIKRLADIKMQTDYGSSAISQEIVSYFLSSGMYETHLSDLREKLKERAEFTERILAENFSDIATWKKPKGGFYIWLRFNKAIVNKQLFLNLIKRNILINPGYIYDSTDYHHIRLSYAYASFEELETGLAILKEETEKYFC
ncbi:aminotransferase-like domain-containing protein [Jeotgalicoccus meleagridis]|uniref:HTH-type transcriptional regulator NorG n=1 Tax=Jeotgalicoccus meleagridis TaxID=2759181 RepID=A0A6V7R2E7_9STAP|nr:PLP-dependent aminotransferase family protein [Jeotgalicoccus meleagridis]CAD2071490.1 HTH-type transcriptional regulator NorG [Jeotgalicoccus meleagridis]